MSHIVQYESGVQGNCNMTKNRVTIRGHRGCYSSLFISPPSFTVSLGGGGGVDWELRRIHLKRVPTTVCEEFPILLKCLEIWNVWLDQLKGEKIYIFPSGKMISSDDSQSWSFLKIPCYQLWTPSPFSTSATAITTTTTDRNLSCYMHTI